MKKGLSIVLALIILTITAQGAEDKFDIQKTYNWILLQESNGSYGSIIDTSAAVIALKASGQNPTNSIDYLASQESAQNCWPKTGCKTKDTAFSMLAYNSMGVATEDVKIWIRNAQTAAMQTGNWWIEITTEKEGICIIKYTKSDKELQKNIKVEKGKFPECGNTTFLNLNNCIEPNFIKNNPTAKLYVDCGTLDDSKISLIYNTASSYYILTESQERVAELDLENGCYGIGSKDSICNYDSTLYTNWVLGLAGAEPTSKIYLRERYDKTNTIHQALLYLILKDNKYLEELKTRQRNDGSWDGDVYKTAMALLAIKELPDYTSQYTKGVNWIKTKQKTDGSFGDVTTTAIALYAAFTDEQIEFPSCSNDEKDSGERGVDCGGICEQYDNCCNNKAKDSGEEGIDCGGTCKSCTEVVCNKNDKCDEDLGEDCNNCPSDCQICDNPLCKNGILDSETSEEGVDCGGQCSSCKKEVCNNDDKCDTDLLERGYEANENSENCPNDCTCGDSVCDEKEDSTSCSKDCVETSGTKCNDDGTCDSDESCSCGDCSGEDRCAEEETTECNDDGTCDADESSISCPNDCEKEKGGFSWIWMAVLFILLAALGYLFYKRKGKGKKKTEPFDFGERYTRRTEPKEFKQAETPKEDKKTVRIIPMRGKEEQTEVEKELERSIKEAKRLINKK